MIKNLYNDMHHKRELEGSSTGNDSEWVVIASLISVILFLGYFILG